MKTNAMRLLDQKKIAYKSHSYTNTDAISGMEVADALGIGPDKIFKTLVTIGKSKEHYVFLVPVNKSLDLKKAAKASGEKSVEMLKEKDLLPLTGYEHGGCSPIGMKKQFKTYIDANVDRLDSFYISGGKIGYQIELKIDDLSKAIPIILDYLTVE